MTKIAPSREPCYCESLQTYLLLTTGGHIEQTKQDYWTTRRALLFALAAATIGR